MHIAALIVLYCKGMGVRRQLTVLCPETVVGLDVSDGVLPKQQQCHVGRSLSDGKTCQHALITSYTAAAANTRDTRDGVLQMQQQCHAERWMSEVMKTYQHEFITSYTAAAAANTCNGVVRMQQRCHVERWMSKAMKTCQQPYTISYIHYYCCCCCYYYYCNMCNTCDVVLQTSVTMNADESCEDLSTCRHLSTKHYL